MKQRLRFTIYHGLAVSLALHSAVALPLVLGSRTLPDEPPLLVIDLQGLVAERQTEDRVMEEAKDVPVREARAVQPTEQPVARQSPQPTPEVRPKEVVADDSERPAPAEVVKVAPVPPAALPRET